MSNVIEPGPLSSSHFAVVKHSFTDKDGLQIETHLLTIKDDFTGIILEYPGYEIFYGKYTGRKPHYRKNDVRPHLCYLAHVLNFIFKINWWKFKIDKLSAVTAEILFEAFDDYIETPIDRAKTIYRSQQSVDLYIRTVSSFFANISLLVPNCQVKPEDLFISEKVYNQRSKELYSTTFVPVYKGKAKTIYESRLMRDIPDEAMDILISQAEIYDPMLVFPIIVGETTGMRLGEIMNMRQCDSMVSSRPGIMFSYFGDKIVDVTIDLSSEYQLRSDGVKVGGIKKHRQLTMYKPFIKRFMEGYKFHCELLSHCSYEKEYSPMFVNNRGKAMTTDNFSDRFSRLINRHFIPALYETQNPIMVAYAQELQNKHLTPHMLRHRFTVKLVNEKLSKETIAKLRGDRSFASAELYCRNKESIDGRLREIHDKMFLTYIEGD